MSIFKNHKVTRRSLMLSTCCWFHPSASWMHWTSLRRSARAQDEDDTLHDLILRKLPG